MTREEQIEKAVSEVVEERQTAVGRKKYGGSYFANWWFKEGVKWADAYPDTRFLWTDAGEEPEKGVEFLCDDHIEGFRVNIWEDAEMAWPDYCCVSGITRWAYVRDLLPKGGER